MTSKEREARRLFKWAVNHYDGDMKRLELALWRVVQNGGGKLPVINTKRTGPALRPYRTPEVA